LSSGVKWSYTVLMLQKMFLLLALFAACALAQPRIFELRTYHTYDGKLEALKANFRDHHLATFKRHGIESIGYWVPRDPELAQNTLIYLLAHPSREAAEKNWAEFRKDPEFLKVAKESEKDGKIVQKVESVYLDPTDFSPMK
jgi:hypothetical protein